VWVEAAVEVEVEVEVEEGVTLLRLLAAEEVIRKCLSWRPGSTICDGEKYE